MDYKAVLEEQIRELQKMQDKIKGENHLVHEACKVATTILELVNYLHSRGM